MKTGQADPPEMVDAVTFAKRSITLEDISEKRGISVGAAHTIVHGDLAFSKISGHWVYKILKPEPRQKKSSFLSYFGKGRLIRVQIRSPRNFFCLAFLRIFCMEEHFEQMAEKSVQRFPCRKNIKAGFSMRRMFFKAWRM